MLPNYGRIIVCPLCKSKTYKVLYPSTLTKEDFSQDTITQHVKNSLDDYTKHAQIVRCTNCTLVYTNPMENMKQVMQGYSDVTDEEYLKTEKFRKLLLAEHLKVVERYKKKGTILDVGSFAGYFLELATLNGWKGEGIEPSVWATKVAKRRGVRTIGTSIESTRLANQKYDVVTLWDVIEHLPDPHSVMKVVQRVLKKDGIIVMGTPNIDSLFARILGKKCPFLIRMHIILYSPKTLRKLFEENGITVLYTGNYHRVFPISYLLDRLKIDNIFYTSLKQTIKAIPFLAALPIPVLLGDSFIMVGKKTT